MFKVEFIRYNNDNFKGFIFFETKTEADKLAKALSELNFISKIKIKRGDIICAHSL